MLLLIFSYEVSAQGISISPSSLQLELYRGESAKSAILISNPSSEELQFRIAAEDHPSWFFFSQEDGALAPGASKEIEITAEPPLDTPNGDYLNFITIYLEPSQEKSEFSLNLAAAVKLKIIVSGKQVISLSVENLNAADTEQGQPIILTAGLSNNGNVRTAPTAEITLTKNRRQVRQASLALPELLPGEQATATLNLSSDGLEIGNYTATARIMLGKREISEQSRDITIHSYGTFTRSGRLLSISLDNEPKQGELSKLTAIFQNTGTIAVKAKLRSEIRIGENLIETLGSEERLVKPGETAELVSYYRPEQPGSYQIISTVLFGDSETKPATLSFNLGQGLRLSAGGIIITAAIVLMGLMLYYGKEVWKMVGRKIEGKIYYCVDCNRPIKHKGRCMLCNVTARKRLDAQEKKYKC